MFENFESVDSDSSEALAEIRAELDELSKPKTNWSQALLVLAVSVLLFSVAGSLGDGMDWTFLGVLVAVVFIHELGHLAAMWWFDYQDLRMFFIPFFGAAASGRKRTATGVQRAIVSLAGPVPGIFLGIAFSFVWLARGGELTGMFALLFLAVNGLNLLPVMPLDGGRFFDTILFSRWPGFQLFVNIVTGGLLVLAGWAVGDWIFGGLGVLLLLFSRTGYKVARLGKQLRTSLPLDVRRSDDIPDEHFEQLAERVSGEVLSGHVAKPRVVAQYLDMVWQGVHSEPPGPGATWALLAVYAVTLIGVPVGAVTAALTVSEDVVVEASADGDPSKKIRRFMGKTVSEVELNDTGSFHGRYAEYSVLSDRPQIVGSYVDGFRDGTWTQFDESRTRVAEASFAAGVLVSARRLVDGDWQECDYDELPIELKASTEPHQYDAGMITGDERREAPSYE